MEEDNSSLFVFVVVLVALLIAIVTAATVHPPKHDDYIRFMAYYMAIMLAESKNGEGTQAYYTEIKPYLIQIIGLYARSGNTIIAKSNTTTDIIDALNDVIVDYNNSTYTKTKFGLLKTTNLTSREIDFEFDNEEPVWNFYLSEKDRALGTQGKSLRTAFHAHFEHSDNIQEAINDFIDLAGIAPKHSNFLFEKFITLIILCHYYREGLNGRPNKTRDGYTVTESYLYSYILDINYEIENTAPPEGIGYDYDEYLSHDYGDTGMYADDLFDFVF